MDLALVERKPHDAFQYAEKPIQRSSRLSATFMTLEAARWVAGAGDRIAEIVIAFDMDERR